MATYYVSPLGSNTAPYGTWATAANLPATAISHGNSVAGPHTIYIAPGQYNSALILTGANQNNSVVIGTKEHGSTLDGASMGIVVESSTNYALSAGVGQSVKNLTLSCKNATYAAIYCASEKSISGEKITLKDCSGIGVNNAGTIVLNKLRIVNSVNFGCYNTGTFTINHGFITGNTAASICLERGTFTGNNLAIVGNAAEAVRIPPWANAATVGVLNNPVLAANATGSATIYVLDNNKAGATLTVNNGNVHSNARVVNRSTDYYTRGVTFSNAIAKVPAFISPRRKGIVVIGVDDAVNIGAAEVLATKLSAAGFKLSYAVDENNATGLGYWGRIAAIANDGHEIMSHTKSHSKLTDLTGLVFIYAAGSSGNTAATITFANDTLTATVSGGAAGHGFVKSVAGLKLSDVISWVNTNYGALSDGASWAASGGTWTATRASSIADVSSVNCFGVNGALPLSIPRYYDYEITQSKSAIGSLISSNGGPDNYQVQTIVFPGEFTDTNVRASVFASGYLGARGTFDADFDLSAGVRKFHVSSYLVDDRISHSNVERNTSSIAEWLNHIGGIVFLYTHHFNVVTEADWDIIISTLRKSNVDVMSMSEAMTWMIENGTETGEAGELSYSVSFTNTDDYHLHPTSPCIGAGVDVGITTDLDGNAIPGAVGYDIGPYSYMPGWKACAAPLPLSAQPCKSHALPIGVGKVTVFPGVASASQIEEAAGQPERIHTVVSGDLEAFIATGIGSLVIQFQMTLARTMISSTRRYPLGNTFLSYWNDGDTGKWALSDGASESVVNFDWNVGQIVTVSIDCDGYDMIIGVA